MKASIYSILLSLLVLLLFATCTKKEADNPFDADCPKELFTPANFKSEMSGTSVRLTWSQQNMTISGFVINRSENGSTTAEVARVDKSTLTWTDTKVMGGTKYDYTINAYAGANLSNPLTTNITTPALGATVTTVSAASNITPNSVVLGGNVTSDGGSPVTERGICYATTQNPTISNSKTIIGSGSGTFSGTITNLAANTTYYAKAFATNSYGTTYGNEVSFTTSQLSVPTVTTTTAVSVTAVGAVLGGNITSDGNSAVIENGICYSTTQNPTTANSKVAIGTGTGAFTKTVTGLTEGTTYYVRAYAINSIGTAYGTQISFTTTPLLLATVTTSNATTVTGTSAVLGGNVTNDGNTAVTERGVCYATTQNPTTAGTKIVIGTGTGAFSNTVTGLTDGTKYYARAYAINSKGTAYGAEISFTTTQISLATITTSAAGNVGSTTAVLGGSVTSDGNSSVTERGVCYAITQNPTTANSKLIIGTGTGTFINTVSGLSGNTTYYARAYAINSKGTVYGNEISFKTNILILSPTVTTDAAINLKTNGATLGGNVTNDGGATVTERGICYNTSGNPTTSNPKIVIGSGTGNFSSMVTGLQANTTYQVKAYAINSQGTSYGNQVSFTTLAFVGVPTITTMATNNITQTTATGGGIITADGGADITARGICYSTNQNPTLADNFTTDGTGTGQYVSQLTGLLPGTTYYLRAYATNSTGTGYGNQINCTTLKSLPIITTKSITDIIAIGCVSGGIITSTGGGTISAKGICWSDLENPTINDFVVNSGSGSGSFNSSIGGAIPNMTYYVRAFATNEIGTSYGDQKTFTTLNNVVYYGFENGLLPSGWDGQWAVFCSKGFNSSCCLKSLQSSSSATLKVNLTSAGQISFYYFLDNGFDGMYTKKTSMDFYIDGVSMGNIPSSSGWNQIMYNVNNGSHTFKWTFNANSGGAGYIDYIILPK